MLVTMEGIDGCGKTTQHERLATGLMNLGLPVAVSREPTDGLHGRRIRELLAQPDAPERARAEQLRDLFLADRREHVKDLIDPALKVGKLVLLDRYYHSSIAYQSAAGLDPEEVRAANESFAPVPDLVIIFDLPINVATRRLDLRKGSGQGPTDGFEARVDYQERVRSQYLAMANLAYVKTVDATCNMDLLESKMTELIYYLFEQK